MWEQKNTNFWLLRNVIKNRNVFNKLWKLPLISFSIYPSSSLLLLSKKGIKISIHSRWVWFLTLIIKNQSISITISLHYWWEWLILIRFSKRREKVHSAKKYKNKISVLLISNNWVSLNKIILISPFISILLMNFSKILQPALERKPVLSHHILSRKKKMKRIKDFIVLLEMTKIKIFMFSRLLMKKGFLSWELKSNFQK
mgnify:CR=1 FL=1